jgi:DNA-binding response OmpR family regulator
MGSVNDLLASTHNTFATYDGDRSILCVQPKSDAQQLLREALKDYTVVIAETAYDALRQFNSSAFDAFVLEYWLPDWSGVSLCRDIRRVEPNAPVCFYTCAAGDEARKRATAAKASAYLYAPADISVIRAHIRTLLERADWKSRNAASYQALAIEHELARYAQLAADPVNGARSLSRATMERLTKIKARKVFIEHGGTLADFERWWSHAFLRAWAALTGELQ